MADVLIAKITYMKPVFFGLIALFFFVSCDEENQIEKEISQIAVNIDVERFDILFAETKPKELQKLKTAYPFMFSSKYADSVWIGRMRDTLQQELAQEVHNKFKDFSLVQDELAQLYQHLKYYFPEVNAPRIITVTSDVDYRNKVIVTDTIAFIALDTYLGKDHKFYGGIQNYLKQNFREAQIIPDLANEYAKNLTYQPKTKTLLDEMVYHGKLLYFKDKVIPFKTDEEKIGYTKEQLDWAIANESEIWSYFVERELLYSTDAQLPARFINPAPFTKFYLELDAESPGRLGQFIGWQIVKAYMNNADASFKQMLITDAETIFKNSKFKPRK